MSMSTCGKAAKNAQRSARRLLTSSYPTLSPQLPQLFIPVFTYDQNVAKLAPYCSEIEVTSVMTRPGGCLCDASISSLSAPALLFNDTTAEVNLESTAQLAFNNIVQTLFFVFPALFYVVYVCVFGLDG